MPDADTLDAAYQEVALTDSDAAQLATVIATLRLASYTSRLAEIAHALGVEPADLDAETMQQITEEARRVAAGMVATHNTDLRSHLAQQPEDATRDALTDTAHLWTRDRARWKAAQVAAHEGLTARNQADRDVIARSMLSIEQRATPGEAACPECQALVARGWIAAEDGPALPLHPNCVHSYQYRRPLAEAARGKRSVWLGGEVTLPRAG